jgi:hypothetical protein
MSRAPPTHARVPAQSACPPSRGPPATAAGAQRSTGFCVAGRSDRPASGVAVESQPDCRGGVARLGLSAMVICSTQNPRRSRALAARAPGDLDESLSNINDPHHNTPTPRTTHCSGVETLRAFAPSVGTDCHSPSMRQLQTFECLTEGAWRENPLFNAL